MTTRKTTTRKRTTKAAPKKKTVSREEIEADLDEVLAEEVQPQVVYVEREPRGFNWQGCLIVVAGLFLVVMLLMCGGGAVYWWTGGDSGPAPAPGPAPATPLSQQIEAAGVTPQHAVYFRKVCERMGNSLETDGKVSNPVYTARGEIADLVGATGSMAVAGSDANAYPNLPDVIDSAFANAWETDEGGELMGGTLSEKDRAEVVRIWRELAQAFAEVAE